MTAQPNPPALFSAPPEINPLGHEGARTQPFYWSLRREVWENRSIYIAPLSVAAVILIGSLATMSKLPVLRAKALLLEPLHRRAAIQMPYNVIAMMILTTAFIVAVFYCLDALHGERRDRSILFWKSLPVSDITAVLAKACVPLIIVPLVTCAIIIGVQLLVLLLSSVALLPSGLSATTWQNVSLLQEAIVAVYGSVVIVLWHAPIYGWLLIISAWARRATFLWAFLPLVGIQFFEWIVANTSHFAAFVRYRLLGFGSAFEFSRTDHPSLDSLAQLTPGRFLSTPGLWIGLVAAAVFVFIAARLRRYHGPL